MKYLAPLLLCLVAPAVSVNTKVAKLGTTIDETCVLSHSACCARQQNIIMWQGEVVSFTTQIQQVEKMGNLLMRDQIFDQIKQIEIQINNARKEMSGEIEVGSTMA